MDFIRERVLFISKYWKGYASGLKATLVLSIIRIFFGALIGAPLVLGCRSKNPFLNKLSSATVEIIRGTPLIVQTTLFVYSILNIIPPEFTFLRDKVFLALVPMCLNSGAYISEIIRAGVQNVDQGQNEVARSLGMSKRQTILHVVPPQATKNIPPALGSEFVTLIRESAVVPIVVLHDMMYYAGVIRGATSKAPEPYFYVAVIYSALAHNLAELLQQFEGGLHRNDRY